MDKAKARAISLALAIATYWQFIPNWATIFTCADKYVRYVEDGTWPKEATDQIGKGKQEDA